MDRNENKSVSCNTIQNTKQKTMKKITMLMSLATLLFLGLSSGKKEITTISIGDEMPGQKISLTTTKDAKTTLVDQKGKKGTLVIFSCNTCPFVIGGNSFAGWEKDYNSIGKIAAEYELGSILVNSNAAKRDKGDNLADMKKRATDKAYVMTYALDKNSKLADEFGAKTTPHVFLFDKDDKLVYEGQISNEHDPKAKNTIPYLREAILALGNGKDIQANKTDAVGCSIKRK